jgi:hypothetical protein
MVESDEFTEIEDPDPDNHEERQRELINEIEEARKALEEKPEKKRFGFFKKKKLVEKKAWETYDEKPKNEPEGSKGDAEAKEKEAVLFDVDAIRAEVAELAGHGIEIKQLESTLPPMKLNLDSSPQPLRTTRSFNDSINPSSPHSDGSVTHPSTADRPEFSRATSKSSAPHDKTEKPIMNGDHGDISMTVDSTAKPPSGGLASPLHLGSDHASTGNISANSHSSDWESAHRPALKPHATTPAPAAAALPLKPIDLEHNAWADEFDEFGGSGEVKMTFE